MSIEHCETMSQCVNMRTKIERVDPIHVDSAWKDKGHKRTGPSFSGAGKR
jgi:hypothetical protein